MIIGLATVPTLFRARRVLRTEQMAAAVTLTVLSLPAAAESHFVLMAIPLALLRLGTLELVVIAGF